MAPWTRTRPSTDTGTTAAPPQNNTIPATGPTTYSNKDAAAAGQGRFRLGVWLRLNGIDLITMACMGAVGLGVYMAPPAPSRSFPLTFVDGEIVYPQFAYPLRKEIVPIWLAAFIAFMAPFVFFCLFQIHRRSFQDLLDTTMGLLKSLITAAVFQVFIKWLIGGLRPHFYAVCQPDVSLTQGSPRGNGWEQIMYDRRVCTGDKDQIDDSLESMPSGHSTAAFAGLIYLALYFNAQLKVVSAHNPAYWKFILMLAPVLGACLIAGALTIDEFHNWYDCFAGACIGTLCAFLAYRQTFASIFDFRFNHILLPRTTSLLHRTPYTGAFAAAAHNPGQSTPFFTYAPPPALPRNLPFAREGGWGWAQQEAANGAPGDATILAPGGPSGGHANNAGSMMR